MAATHGNGEPGRWRPPTAMASPGGGSHPRQWRRTVRTPVPQSAATTKAFLREKTMVRDMAVMYVMGSIENPDVHLGVGKLVDIGVHQLILDTPVWWGLCHLCNGGRYKHHAPFIERRNDSLCLRTSDFLTSQGWDIDEELWAIDGANCSPCDNKVPDSH
ncbi:hypothetical protein ACFW2K_39215 [Streptomyces nigra]|uniref:hypothetical protein n=1 Tax=Streptomyces nigra TaxID=1827580 RepID=UPI0036A88CFD